jgi:hypothetical protein
VDGVTLGTIAAVIVPVVSWVDYRLRAVEHAVALLGGKMDLLLQGKKVVDNASDPKTDMGTTARSRRA